MTKVETASGEPTTPFRMLEFNYPPESPVEDVIASTRAIFDLLFEGGFNGEVMPFPDGRVFGMAVVRGQKIQDGQIAESIREHYVGMWQLTHGTVGHMVRVGLNGKQTAIMKQ